MPLENDPDPRDILDTAMREDCKENTSHTSHLVTGMLVIALARLLLLGKRDNMCRLRCHRR